MMSAMIRRFCAYAALRNLRLFDPFMVLFLLHDLRLDFTLVGLVIAYEKALVSALEVPLAVVADRRGRRRTLTLSFVLAAVAMIGLALAGRTGSPLTAVLGALSLYAVAEALRTGTHKAIMLDWLTRRGERDRKVEVIGTTRFFSKTSAGAAAMIGGLVVWLGGAYAPLFAASAVPTALCAALVWSYPRELDETTEAPPAKSDAGRWQRLMAGIRRPGLLWLVIPSVLFESQLKLAGSFVQPALAKGVDALDLTVVGGVGAVVYGAWHLTAGLLAGGASLGASTLVQRAGGVGRALFAAHLAAAAVLGVTAAGLIGGLLAPGLVLMLGLGAVQNARRPIWVAAVDDVMDPRWRATTLSAESLARAVVHALTAIVVGVVADHAGLGAAFAVMAALVGLAAALQRRDAAG